MASRIAVPVVALLAVLTLADAPAWAQPPGAGGGAAAAAPLNPNAVVPGEFVIEPATLINLGFEWFIHGDDNRNAAVAVSYRKKGDSQWKNALPLLRLQSERIFHVYPHGFKGQKIEPSFEGLMCAYNFWCAGTDWATSGRPRVTAGDTILVHAGLYKYNRFEYTNDPAVNRTVPLDGTYYLTADGTAEMPIAIKGAGDGEVIFDGNGNFALFDVKAADFTYFEGLTFRNSEVAIAAGTQFIAGAKGLTVKHCKFENVGAGIFTNYSGSSHFYIADNRFIGRNDPKHLIGWNGAFWTKFNGVEGQVFPPAMASYVAVKLYGPGHVVAYNYIADFHDGINVETYGNPDGSSASGPGILDGPHYPTREYWDRRPVAIDFYNNYITNS